MSTKRLHTSTTWLDPRTLRLSVTGEVDITTGADLAAALHEAVTERPHRLIVDLTEVPFADSNLIHALVRSNPEVSSGDLAQVRVSGARPQVVRLLTVCGLAELCAHDA